MNLFSGAMQPNANHGNSQSLSFLRYSLETILLLLKYLFLRMKLKVMADATSLPFFSYALIPKAVLYKTLSEPLIQTVLEDLHMRGVFRTSSVLFT